MTDRLKAALRKGTCECTAVPVCCGSAYRNKGVQKLLDAILEYMPAPTDIPAIKGTDLDGPSAEDSIFLQGWSFWSSGCLHSFSVSLLFCRRGLKNGKAGHIGKTV